MRAAILRNLNEVSVADDVELADPSAGEVRVKLVASGVCHTDVAVMQGHIPNPLPTVMGHEGVGIVDAVGPGVGSVSVGDHVVLNYALYCGRCYQCQLGNLQLCEQYLPHIMAGTLADGTSRIIVDGQPGFHFHHLSSFAEYAVVPEVCAVPVRRDAPLEQLTALGCGAVTGWGGVVRRAKVTPGSTVAVIGTGGVGLAAVMAARVAGASRIIACDVSESALELAERVGATDAVLVSPSDDTASLVRKIVPRGVDYGFDAAGLPGTLEAALFATRDGGDVIAYAASQLDQIAAIPVMSVVFERRLTGTSGGSIKPRVDIPALVDLFMDGRFPVDELSTRRYELSQTEAALQDMVDGKSGRGVILMDHA